MLHEEMHSALAALDQALRSHDQWCEALYATLICRLTPDLRDIDEEAHRKCRFGQWLYDSGLGNLSRHPGFAEVEGEHQRMHRAAATLLQSSLKGGSISLTDYERFSTSLKRMRLELLTIRHELEDALYYLDPLTGAASRIGMLTKLREQQHLVQRKIQSCCVVMMDVDHFKHVNDTHGHQIGDQVLSAVARCVGKLLRPYDRLFRYGGEEFLISLPDADLEEGHRIIERIREQLASLSHEADSGLMFPVTVSFGLTLLDPDAPVEQSLDRADKALYSAKRSGRNRTVIWDASLI